MTNNAPILVTGAAGQLGAVGWTVTGLLLERGLRVRAMVRREDERAAALRAAGAEVVLGDLLEPADVYRVVSGCPRVYFAMSVSAGYLEATVTMAAVAREVGVDALVNMSQTTVSQMSLQNTTPSPQQRQHWLSEQALAVRPAGRHHPSDGLLGGLLPSPRRSDRPSRLAIIGGGPIGCELAQAFQRLGSQVRLLHKHAHPLDREDMEAAAIVQKALLREGVNLLLNARITGV